MVQEEEVTVPYRILLAAGALVILLAMLRKIRKSEMRISDSLFWLFFVVTLILLALFPEIAFFFSGLLGIESPANLVFLYVIALLLIREFASTVELSRLRGKVTTLAQEEALGGINEPNEGQVTEEKD